jgi:hypothetical protein
MERMAAHPEVGGYGEILLPGVEGWSDWPPGARDRPFYTSYLKERGVRRVRAARHFFTFRYLDYVFEPRRGFRSIGFKLMYNQVRQHPAISLYLLRRRVRLLHLVRRNVLDLYLSREALLARKFAHARAPDEREEIMVHVNAGKLLGELRLLRLQQRSAAVAARLSGLPVHDVVYEEALADDAVLHNALRFVGIGSPEAFPLDAVMLKLAPSSHRATIVNFEEVAQALAGTGFAGLLRP